jgi:hypothetical protein
MLTSHELFGFMSPSLANQILEDAYADERELYKATLASVANARRLRPVFLERQPRAQRHTTIVATLGKPAHEELAAGLLRGWLLKKQKPMLCAFLDALEIPNKDGAVEDLPESMEDAKLNSAVDKLLGGFPKEVVTVYLHAFNGMNDKAWKNLDSMLQNDARLQF